MDCDFTNQVVVLSFWGEKVEWEVRVVLRWDFFKWDMNYFEFESFATHSGTSQVQLFDGDHQGNCGDYQRNNRCRDSNNFDWSEGGVHVSYSSSF